MYSNSCNDAAGRFASEHPAIVTGAIQTDRNGDRTLWVKTYELIDDDPDDYDEDRGDDFDDYDEFRGFDDEFRDDDDDRPWRRGTGTDE